MTCWKDPQECPVGGSDEDRAALTKALESRFYSSLSEKDVLSWSPSPKGKFIVA